MKKTNTTAIAANKILAIDIGGSHIKATLLDNNGNMIADYKKLATPAPASPEKVLQTIKELAAGFKGYTHISCGFPGYVKNGVVMTAPNLGSEAWQLTDLEKQLTLLLGKPARVVNDADMQGLGVVNSNGKGIEIVITLGTGVGTAWLLDGKLMPHLELAHHPLSKTKDYDQYVGDKALEEIGRQRWNKRMLRVLNVIKTVFNYDHLYIGGGNASKLTCTLENNMTLVNNKDGIKGGARLWQQ